MSEEANNDDVGRFALLASAISRRPLGVAPGRPGEPSWTDGNVVFVDVDTCARAQIESLAVQASLLAAGSLDREIVRGLARRPMLTRRYLAVEGHRALATVEPLLPPAVRTLIHPEVAAGTHSAAASLAAARSGRTIVEPPASFGTIRASRLLASTGSANPSRPRRSGVSKHRQRAPEITDEANFDQNVKDSPASIGGGGAIGRLLSKMLTAVRQLRGGGSPAADSPTHFTRSGRPGSGQAPHCADVGAIAEQGGVLNRDRGRKYPEWDVNGGRYHDEWCTVLEVEPDPKQDVAAFMVPDTCALRRSLARLGLGMDRYRRQAQGDDIDIDANIEARVDLMAGATPDDMVFIHSVRRRRDLAVLVLLDISGSAAEPAGNGQTVHEQQRAAAAALAFALHELGDRVALYAYCSQGRSAVRLIPVKRFGEHSRALLMRRLHSLVPGGYSRLGAAIRHGTTLVRDHGGTLRRLLVVLSDGLAYDHGYEPSCGAADARRALGEARSQGVGCLCLSVGSSTDSETLRRVFGTAAHAALPAPAQLGRVIGPLFCSALRSADLRRRASRGER